MASSYTGEKSIDYTNTNPDYWGSVNQFFNEGKTAATGETGIWIPNLEKEGAEATALAATAGGVKAFSGTNYAKASGTDPTDNVGAEKPIRLASIYRGGTEYKGKVVNPEAVKEGHDPIRGGPMGSLPEYWHGRYIKGGEIMDRPRGSMYTDRGGDFTGMLMPGQKLDNPFLDALLGPRDGDGLRGTYEATTTGVPTHGAGGTTSGGGAFFSGPTAPLFNTVNDSAFIQNRLADLLQTNTPLWKSARTLGLQVANSMGIPLDSSITQGIVMNQIMKIAIPIVQADAKTYQHQQLVNQGYANEFIQLINKAYISEFDTRLKGSIQLELSSLAANAANWRTMIAAYADITTTADMSANAANIAMGSLGPLMQYDLFRI